MEYVACGVCQSPMRLKRKFFRMKDKTFQCETCVTDQSAVLYNIKDDAIIQAFAAAEEALSPLNDRGLWTQVVNTLYYHVQEALKVRAEEMWSEYVEPPKEATGQFIDSAASSGPSSEAIDNWSCSRCQFSNLPVNKICYSCRSSRDGSFAPVYESESVLDINSLTVREGSGPWRCKCGKENPTTVQRCECGFLNLGLVQDPEVEDEVLPAAYQAAPGVPAMANTVYKCTSCGYEYNRVHSATCFKCNQPNHAASSPQAAMTSPPPYPQAPMTSPSLHPQAAMASSPPYPQGPMASPSSYPQAPITSPSLHPQAAMTSSPSNPQATASMTSTPPQTSYPARFPSLFPQTAVPVVFHPQAAAPVSPAAPAQMIPSVQVPNQPSQFSAPMAPAQQVPAPMVPSQHNPANIGAFPQAPQEEQETTEPRVAANSQIWACSCKYEYNLLTAESCTKCGLANPFLRPKPPSKKCVKCKTRDVYKSTNTCWQCKLDNEYSIKLGSTTWACAPCSIGGIYINQKCSGCKRTQEEVYPELKKASVPDSPEKASWTCKGCGAGNESSRMRCMKCDQTKETLRCSACGAVKNAALSVCEKCYSQRSAEGSSGQVPQSENPYRFESFGL